MVERNEDKWNGESNDSSLWLNEWNIQEKVIYKQ
jgi:hypothetical protein